MTVRARGAPDPGLRDDAAAGPRQRRARRGGDRRLLRRARLPWRQAKGDSLLDYLGARIAQMQQTPSSLQPCVVLLPPRGAKTSPESPHVPALQSGRRVHQAWAAWCC